MAARDVDADVPSGLPTDRYDLLLAAIPLAFALATVGAATVDLPLRVGATAGGVLAVLTTGYALFGAPPTDESPRSRGPTR